MRKPAYFALCTAALFSFSQVVLARGPGAAGGSPHFGGPAAGSQAAANSNGRFATDRDRGLDRAEDRMSAQGRAHEKATDAVKKRTKGARGNQAAIPATASK